MVNVRYVAGILIALSVVSNGMAAQYLPNAIVANYVNDVCKTQNADCANYLLGLKDGLALGLRGACFAHATSEQLRLAYGLYASEHPDMLAKTAAELGAAAFSKLIPCS